MKNQAVYEDITERERLQVQNALLSEYEAPILSEIFSGKKELYVLDIGCSDGEKTVSRFSDDAVSSAVGIEYNIASVRRANDKFGGGKFTFYCCDAETDEMNRLLSKLTRRDRSAPDGRGENFRGFDLIYMSFVLMHLRDGKALLSRLKPYLADGGTLFIIDADDGMSTLSLDDGGLLPEFLSMLSEDCYGGKRDSGRIIPDLLAECGYTDITEKCGGVFAGRGSENKKKKEAIFRTYFSFLPEDVDILLRDEKSGKDEKEKYESWKSWLDVNYRKLHREIVSDESEIFMGTRMITCRKDGSVK
jgi:SAM-dependent methyltransferase